MGAPVAPGGPAGDSAQQPTTPNVVPDKIPSAIDAAAEAVGVPTEPLPDAEKVSPTDEDLDRVPEAQTDLNNTGEDDEVSLLKAQLAALQEDHNTVNVLRNDPVAKAWLEEHFARKSRGMGEIESATGDADADVPDSALNAKVDRLFNMVEQLAVQQQQNTARSALAEFAAQNPIVRNPRVASKMQEVLRSPGAESLSLQRVLTLALSELGISDKQGGKAPLRASESAGAPRESSTEEDAVQTKIDSQDSFEKALDVALKETAREQGFI